MSVDIEPDSEWRKVIAAVRAVHPKVPIVVFGGHHHVRFSPPVLGSSFFLVLHECSRLFLFVVDETKLRLTRG